MDLISFGQAYAVLDRVVARNRLEDFQSSRVAQHGEKKDVKEWVKSYLKRGKIKKQKKSQKDFLTRFGSGF